MTPRDSQIDLEAAREAGEHAAQWRELDRRHAACDESRRHEVEARRALETRVTVLETLSASAASTLRTWGPVAVTVALAVANLILMFRRH